MRTAIVIEPLGDMSVEDMIEAMNGLIGGLGFDTRLSVETLED